MVVPTAQKTAELLERINGLFEGDDSLPKTIDRFKALRTEFEELKKLDLKSLVEEFDKLKARQDRVIRSIRTNRHTRGYVPGLEDEDLNKFSIVRAIVGVKTGNWANAGYEKEVMDAARKAASQSVGDDSLGGYFVPDQMIPDVIQAIYTMSVFVGLAASGETNVSVLDGLVGSPVKIPKLEGGTIAYWIGEEDEYTDSNMTVGDVSLTPKKLGVLVRMTDAVRRFTSFGFESLMRNDMARAAAKKLDWTIAYGNGGADMPRGIIAHQGIKIYSAQQATTYTQAQVAAAGSPLNDWDGAVLNFDGLDNMELALVEDDIVMDSSFKWISSPRFFRRLRQLKVDHYSSQTTNQAYLLGMPMLTNQALTDIIGQFSMSTQIPFNNLPGESINGATDSTNEKYTDVFAGNFSDVLLGRWGGLEIEDDGGRGKGFTSDHWYVKLRLYADIQIRQERSIIVCPDAQVIA